MDLLSTISIALCLSFDAFSVAISYGIYSSKRIISTAFIIGIFFGIFQGFMPIIGWFIGLSFRNVFKSINYWIAFLLLFLIGIGMIFKKDEQENILNLDNIKIIITLSFATSIDALATGVSLSALRISIIRPSILIGIITLITSFLGVLIGKKIKNNNIFSNIEILAGILLIIIALKIILEYYY